MQQVGAYRLLAPLEGDAFQAIGPDGREVIFQWIKLDGPGPELVARVQHELQSLTQLQRPNLVSLITWGEHQGTPFLVLEPDSARRFPNAASLAADLRRALGYAATTKAPATAGPEREVTPRADARPDDARRAETRRDDTRRDNTRRESRSRGGERKAPRRVLPGLVAGLVIGLSPFVVTGVLAWRKAESVSVAKLEAATRRSAGDLQGALEAADTVIELAPGAEAHVQRAQLKAALGDAQGALVDLTAALRYDPDLREAYVARAELRLETQDVDGAIADAGEVLRLAPEDSAAFVTRGRAYMARGLFSEASLDFERAIQLHPGNAAAYLHRGEALAAEGKLESAIDDFSSAINLDSNLGEAYAARAQAKSANGAHASAIRDFNRAVDLLEAPTAALAGRGIAHRHADSPDLAIADLQRALSLDESLPGVARELAFARSRDDPKRAIADFDRALAADPSDVKGWAGRGAAKLAIKDLRGAARDYSEAIRRAPRSAELLARRAEVRHALRDWSGALGDLDAALKIDRHDAAIWQRRAALRLEQDDLAGAILDAGEAVRRGASALSYATRARALYRKGIMSEAASDLTNAIALAGDPDAELHALRALAHRELGNTREAAADAALALRLAPSHEYASQLRLVVAEGDAAPSPVAPARIDEPFVSGDRGTARAPAPELPQGTHDESPHVTESHSDPRFREAGQKRRDGDLDGAISDLTALVADDPKHFYYNVRGYCEMQLRRYGAAIESFREGHALDPECGCSMGFAGDAHKFLGDMKSALEAYDVAVEKRTPDLGRVLCNRGQAREETGDFQGAVADYTASIEANPPGAGLAYYNRGGTLRKLRKLDESLNDLNTAVRLMPNYSDALLQRGMTKGDRGDMRGACEDFEASLRLNPGQQAGPRLRSMIKKVLGRRSAY